MATYIELRDIVAAGTGDLQKKILVAITIKAQALVDLPTTTAAQLAWAKDALANPQAYLVIVLNSVLAANNTASTAVITSASDTTVQTAVDSVVDKLLAV